jgi:hypothetical protein
MGAIVLLLVAAVVVVAVLAALLKAKSQGGTEEIWPFYAKKPVRLMPCERRPELQNRVQIIGACTQGRFQV